MFSTLKYIASSTYCCSTHPVQFGRIYPDKISKQSTFRQRLDPIPPYFYPLGVGKNQEESFYFLNM